MYSKLYTNNTTKIIILEPRQLLLDHDFVLCFTDFGKILENFAVVNIENKCFMLIRCAGD